MSLTHQSLCPLASSQILQPDHILVSFDVVSLFINVPIGLAIDITRCRLQSDPSLQSRTDLYVDELINLLKFSLSASYLSFLSWRCISADFWHCHGVISVSICCKSCHGRCRGQSLGVFWCSFALLEKDDTCTAVPGPVTKFGIYFNTSTVLRALSN